MSFFKKAGHSISSAAHSTKEAVTGPKHRSGDEHFNEALRKFEESRKRLERMEKDMKSFLAGADTMLVAMNKVAEDTLTMAPQTGPLRTLAQAHMDMVKRMQNDKKQYLEADINEKFIRPLETYMAQYRELQTRIKERDHRGHEMDKIQKEKEKYAAKGDPRLGGTETRLENAKHQYNDINDEILQDIPKLVSDTELFFEPLLAQLLVNQSKYFTALQQHAAAVANSPQVANAHVPQVREVITPKGNSAVSRHYQSNTNPYGSGQGATSPAAATSPRNDPPYAQPPVPVRAGPPIPQRTPQARALWDFTGQAGELVFKAGDIINVLSSMGDWWQGEVHGMTGAFPGNYVQMI